MISPILPWWTSAGERAPVAASANRICTSRARMRYTEPASRSIRREISRISRSFTAAGAERSALSIVITTSAWLRAGRLPEPAKITASMSEARSDLCEVSPIAQRSASTRLDLPQPFGPTTPVRPGSIVTSVGSTKDLKPDRRSRAKCTAAVPGSSVGRDALLGELLVEDRLEGVEAGLAFDLLALDHEGRGGVDLVGRGGVLTQLDDGVGDAVVGQ